MNVIEDLMQSEITKIILIGLIGYVINIAINMIYNHTVKTESINNKYIKNIIQAIVAICCTLFIFDMFESTRKFTNLILASSGLMVAVLGFAAQESIGNIINGLFISLFKPFEIGDRINLLNSNITGITEDISLRHTVLRTFSNSRVIIPNSVMNKEILENSHFKDTIAGNFLDITISYDSDINKAIEIIKSLVGNHTNYVDIRSEEEMHNEKVEVLIRELGVNGIHLRTTVWTNDIGNNFKTCSDLRMSLLKEFKDNDIKIPYNHLEIIDNRKHL